MSDTFRLRDRTASPYVEAADAFAKAAAQLAFTINRNTQTNPVILTVTENGMIACTDSQGIWSVIADPVEDQHPDPALEYRLPDGTILRWHLQRSEVPPYYFQNNVWLGMRINQQGDVIGGLGPARREEIRTLTEEAANV